MIKKILAAATGTVLALSCLSITAAAEPETAETQELKLPFELTAPTNVLLNWLEGGDSLTTMDAVWTMNNDMCKWMSEVADPNSHDATLEKLQKEYGYSDLAIYAQIDWAIDDPENGWHWTKYWDGENWTDDEGRYCWSDYGKDKDYNVRVGDWDLVSLGLNPDTVNECWILRGNTINNNPDYSEEVRAAENEWYFGNELIPGLKNQLKDDQYTLVEIDPETHDQAIKIDWTQHTAYIRVRWAIIASEEDNTRHPVLSGWSDAASYGKDAKEFVPLTKEDLAPPVISDLKYYPDEFNNYPQIAVTLTVPEELSKNLSAVSSKGGTIRVEWEGRVPGGEWVGLQGDFTINAGEYVVALQNLAEAIIRQNSENGVSTPDVILEKDSPVELRARYSCIQPFEYKGEYLEDFYSDYSETLSFGTQEMSKPEQTSVKETSVGDSSKIESSKPAEKQEEAKCKLCKNCPAPLGICIWIWIAIIVAIVVIVVIIVVVVMKNKKKKAQTPAA